MVARAWMRTVSAALLTLLLTPAASHAGIESAGTRAASFLSQGASPAVLGMGGAALGLSRDINGAALNPASGSAARAAVTANGVYDWPGCFPNRGMPMPTMNTQRKRYAAVRPRPGQ